MELNLKNLSSNYLEASKNVINEIVSKKKKHFLDQETVCSLICDF